MSRSIIQQICFHADFQISMQWMPRWAMKSHQKSRHKMLLGQIHMYEVCWSKSLWSLAPWISLGNCISVVYLRFKVKIGHSNWSKLFFISLKTKGRFQFKKCFKRVHRVLINYPQFDGFKQNLFPEKGFCKFLKTPE